jgi:hypothetical protein
MAYRELAVALAALMKPTRAATLATLMFLPLAACGQDVEAELAACTMEAVKVYPDMIQANQRDSLTRTCMLSRGYDYKFGPSCLSQWATCYTPRGLVGRAQQWAGSEIEKLSSGASGASR